MKAHTPFSNILVPTDGSETSINAGRLAIQIAATHHTKLTFVYVTDANVASEVAAATSKPRDLVCENLAASAHRYLDYLARLATNYGLTANTVVRHGTPYVEITELAREIGADLIVIGRVSGKGTQRLGRIGAVAERVIQYAHCPVLTVRYTVQ